MYILGQKGETGSPGPKGDQGTNLLKYLWFALYICDLYRRLRTCRTSRLEVIAYISFNLMNNNICIANDYVIVYHNITHLIHLNNQKNFLKFNHWLMVAHNLKPKILPILLLNSTYDVCNAANHADHVKYGLWLSNYYTVYVSWLLLCNYNPMMSHKYLDICSLCKIANS